MLCRGNYIILSCSILWCQYARTLTVEQYLFLCLSHATSSNHIFKYHIMILFRRNNSHLSKSPGDIQEHAIYRIQSSKTSPSRLVADIHHEQSRPLSSPYIIIPTLKASPPHPKGNPPTAHSPTPKSSHPTSPLTTPKSPPACFLLYPPSSILPLLTPSPPPSHYANIPHATLLHLSIHPCIHTLLIRSFTRYLVQVCSSTDYLW